MEIRVLVADDHPVVREGLRAILTAAGMRVVAEAEEGRQALALLRETQPDVVLVDIALPGLSGIELCRRARRRFLTTKVVLISMFDEPAWRTEGALAGAAAYLLKTDPPERIVEAVRRVARGEVLLPPLPGPRLPLTPREREVVQLIAEGKKLSEIAQILSRSPTTVRSQKGSAMKKLGARSTAELVRRAREQGIIKVPTALLPGGLGKASSP